MTLIILAIIEYKINLRVFLFKKVILFGFKNNSSMTLSWSYVFLLSIINFLFCYINNIFLFCYIFYFFYYIYKFLLFNIIFSLKNNISYYKILIAIYYIFMFSLKDYIFILFLVQLIDLFVCITKDNIEYNLAFNSFTEDFYEIILTSNGKIKIISYFIALIYNNNYYDEKFRDDYDYYDELDFVYKNFNDKFN